MDQSKLTKEEEERLEKTIEEIGRGENSQVEDLVRNCKSRFQFAKTHSVYIKDWESTKKRLEDNLRNGNLPAGVRPEFQRAFIDAVDKIIQRKLAKVRSWFEFKFGEPIYNYLGPDGKTKGLFGGLFGK